MNCTQCGLDHGSHTHAQWEGRHDTPNDELPGMLAVAKGIAEQKWPHTMDAMAWADEFVKLNPGADHGLMLTWFANAIMAGYDTAQSRAAPSETKATCSPVLVDSPGVGEMKWCEKHGYYFGKDQDCPASSTPDKKGETCPTCGSPCVVQPLTTVADVWALRTPAEIGKAIADKLCAPSAIGAPWIPVIEKTPADNKQVIVWGRHTKAGAWWMAFGHIFAGKWWVPGYMDSTGAVKGEITHWQPQPTSGPTDGGTDK